MHRNEPQIAEQRLKNDLDAARYLGITVSTIRKWRFLGRGPRFRKIGSLVRYDLADLNAFIDSSPAGGGGGV